MKLSHLQGSLLSAVLAILIVIGITFLFTDASLCSKPLNEIKNVSRALVWRCDFEGVKNK